MACWQNTVSPAAWRFERRRFGRVKSFRKMALCWESITAFISLLSGNERDWVLLLASLST